MLWIHICIPVLLGIVKAEEKNVNNAYTEKTSCHKE